MSNRATPDEIADRYVDSRDRLVGLIDSAVATETEWARALPGRRSRRQVRAYSWSADPAPYLDPLCPFGLLPDADVES